jgi:hypothetical protein
MLPFPKSGVLQIVKKNIIRDLNLILVSAGPIHTLLAIATVIDIETVR